MNGFWILALVPVFTFGVYPFVGEVREGHAAPEDRDRLLPHGALLPHRGVDRVADSGGPTVSVWWQILAYGVLSASEVLVSITGLEFSYKQAPLRMKSFIMALFLFPSALGNAAPRVVN